MITKCEIITVGYGFIIGIEIWLVFFRILFPSQPRQVIGYCTVSVIREIRRIDGVISILPIKVFLMRWSGWLLCAVMCQIGENRW